MLKIFRSNKYSLYMEIKMYVEENILYNFSSRDNHYTFWAIFFQHLIKGIYMRKTVVQSVLTKPQM